MHNERMRAADGAALLLIALALVADWASWWLA